MTHRDIVVAPRHRSPAPRTLPCQRGDIVRRRAATGGRKVTRLAWRPLRRLPYDRRSSASAPRHATAAPPRLELSLALLGDTQRVLTASTHTLSSARYGTKRLVSRTIRMRRTVSPSPIRRSFCLRRLAKEPEDARLAGFACASPCE